MALETTVGDGVAVGVMGDVVLTYWVKPATTERWNVVLAAQRKAIKQYGSVASMSVIAESSSPPDRDLRQKMQSDLRALGTDLRRFVVAPLGSSVWKGVVRALVRTILMMSGQGKQMALVDTITEGARVLVETRTRDTPPPRDVEDAFHELKELASTPRARMG